MLQEAASTFHSEKMSIRWIEEIDGVEIFPKLPSQLREYHKRWERNKRIQEALDKMKDDSELLKNFMNEQMPDDNNNDLHIDDADGQQECIHGYPAEVMPPLTE